MDTGKAATALYYQRGRDHALSVFMNSHDGTGAIKAAMTPIRVVCQNTLNLALSNAKRSWSANHVGNINGKLDDARYTLPWYGQISIWQSLGAA